MILIDIECNQSMNANYFAILRCLKHLQDGQGCVKKYSSFWWRFVDFNNSFATTCKNRILGINQCKQD